MKRSFLGEYHHFSSLCAVNLGYYDNNLETQIISIVPGTPSTSWQKFFLIEFESEKSFLSWYTTLRKNYVPICCRSNHHRQKLLSEETLGREELFFKIFLIEGILIILFVHFALTIFLLDYENLKGLTISLQHFFNRYAIAQFPQICRCNYNTFDTAPVLHLPKVYNTSPSFYLVKKMFVHVLDPSSSF